MHCPHTAQLCVHNMAANFFLGGQSYYRPTLREVSRLLLIAQSPVLSHFEQSLSGISTIRAYQASDRMIAENASRVDSKKKYVWTQV